MNIQVVPANWPGNQTELTKPCPFCGEDPPLAAREYRYGLDEGAQRYLVGCESDECPINPQASGKTINEAWGRWNVRAPVAAEGVNFELLAALEAMMGMFGGAHPDDVEGNAVLDAAIAAIEKAGGK